MSLSSSPRTLKAGLVLIHPESAQVQRIISLQYNPEKLTRSLQVNAAGGEAADRSEAMRFKGPAVETIKLEADIDAADQLEFPDQHRTTVEHGIAPQLRCWSRWRTPRWRSCGQWTSRPVPARWRSRPWRHH